MSHYLDKANKFLEETNATINIKYLKNDKHFTDDESTRDIYEITITRGNRKILFNYGASIMNSQYYQDKIAERTYALNGKSRTGNYTINNIQKYNSTGHELTLIKGKLPSNYDILTCLTKYDPGDFDNFCSEFGYSNDSMRVHNIWIAVKKEYTDLCTLFTDEELNKLNEIE